MRESGAPPPVGLRGASLRGNLRTAWWKAIRMHTVNHKVFLESVASYNQRVFDHRTVIEIRFDAKGFGAKTDFHLYDGSSFSTFRGSYGLPPNHREPQPQTAIRIREF